MRKHRVIRFVAALLFLAALVCLLAAVASAFLLGGRGWGAGWGPGWRGWITLPLLVAAFVSVVSMVVLGALLLLLVRIEQNLGRAGKTWEEIRTLPPSPQAARPELPLQERAAPAATAAAGLAPALVAEVAAPEAETGQPEVTPLRAGVALPEAELPRVEVLEAPMQAALPEVTFPQVEVAAPEIVAAQETPAALTAPAVDDMAALKVQVAALQARLVEMQGRAPASQAIPAGPVAQADLVAELPEVAAEEALASAEPPGKLPGSNEVARIAAEMAALKSAVSSSAGAAPSASAAGAAPAAAEAGAATAALETGAAGQEDDLLAITGIDPVFASRLRQAGLTTFGAIAAASDEQLAEIAGADTERVQREKWRDQARLFGLTG